ncbi:GNAT family N-acetyltransferase [Nocardiopsis alkaliphila]|uniref:GNAT family N-acetyltransferase n=1 Tax=Nocardiopsis alkaliphila TaxID=225762 RepID=UPI001EF9E6F0|nr:GNAT family N-acetyltransferase [Nocardiopsis alkaliphila]
MASKDTEFVVAVSLAADSLFTEAGVMLPLDDPRQMFDHVERVMVAEVDGRVEGLAATVTLDGGTHLEQLAVHPDHGRRGVGGALVEAVCAEAAGRGHDRVTLTTFRDLPWNGPWYERRGFSVFPRPEWGPGLVRQWAVEEEAGIMVRPRIAMVRRLRSPSRPCPRGPLPGSNDP